MDDFFAEKNPNRLIRSFFSDVGTFGRVGLGGIGDPIGGPGFGLSDADEPAV